MEQELFPQPRRQNKQITTDPRGSCVDILYRVQIELSPQQTDLDL